MSVHIIEEFQHDCLRLSVKFTLANKPLELWFELPAAHAGYLTDRADPFLLALLLPFMKAKQPLTIANRPTSPEFLRNLEELQLAWMKWKPDQYQAVSTDAPLVASSSLYSKKKALVAFSGGVDGAFVLWGNCINPEKCFPFPVQAILYVEGFHIPLDQVEASRLHIANVNHIVKELGVELITVRTNLRKLGNWYDYHGLALASCMALFSKEFSTALIGSSHPYSYLRFPWGSNPLTDRLFSSEVMEFAPYGNGFTRLEKISALRHWHAFQQHITVCTRSFVGNCGKCEKCKRTLLAYLALNLRIPPTFPRSLHMLDVITILAYQPQEIQDYKNIFSNRSHSASPFLFFLLGINILLNQFVLNLLRFTGLKTIPFRRNKSQKLYQ